MLTRDTFLPEEGSWQQAALLQKENVRTFGFEDLNFAFFLWYKVKNRTDSWLPCAKGAGAERLRD